MPKFWKFADISALLFSTSAIVLFFFGTNLGRLEGRFFPVVDQFQVTTLYETDDGFVNFWGQFNLVRNDCDFLGTEWFLVGLDGRLARLPPVDYLSGAKARGRGNNSFGPWFLQSTPQQFQNNTRGESIHQCYWHIFGERWERPWRTRTYLYP